MMAAASTPAPTLATLPEVCLVHVCSFLDARGVELFSLGVCLKIRAALRSGVALDSAWQVLAARAFQTTPRYARKRQGADAFARKVDEALERAVSCTNLALRKCARAFELSTDRANREAFDRALCAARPIAAVALPPLLRTFRGDESSARGVWPWRERFASAWLREERAYSKPWGHISNGRSTGLEEEEYLPPDLAEHTVLLASLCSLRWKLWYSTMPADSPGQDCQFTRLCSPRLGP